MPAGRVQRPAERRLSGSIQAFSKDHVGIKMAAKNKKWLKKILPLVILLFIIVIIFLIILNFTILSCSKGFRPCEAPDCVTLVNTFLDSRDMSIDPCQDFYGYVCGNWDANDTLALETGSVNAFDLLWEENQLILKELLESKDSLNISAAEEKAKRFYQSCMDTEKIEELGAQPMIDLIKKVGGWSVTGSWKRKDFNETLRLLIGEYNTFPFFRAYSRSSPLNPNTNVIQIDHPLFDMPSKSQFENESDYPKVLRVYLSYLQQLTEFLGGEPNTTGFVIPTVFSFISKLLNEVTPLTERQERRMLYTPTTIAGLQAMAPAIDWLACLQAAFFPLRLNNSEPIFVHDMDYMMGMSRLVEMWQKSSYVHVYMVLCLVQTLSPALDKKFQEARRELSGGIQTSDAGTLGGTPRWKKCVSDTSRFFEPVLGSMFIRKTFPPKNKKLAEDIFAEVLTALDSRLDQLQWMDKETQRNARKKLHSIDVRIGYPPRIMEDAVLAREYEELEIEAGAFFNNVVKLNSPSRHRHLESLDPHGKANWEVDIASTHSYYSISQHAVVFPAGMFRSPFFHLDFPSSVNFGAIGVFMAHELLHAFYVYVPSSITSIMSGDENELEELLTCMQKQYESYTLQNLTVNSALTLLENMADSGGVLIAHQAYENWLKKHKQDTILPKIGLNHQQLFYSSFAQTMCEKQTMEKLRISLQKDQHSPKPLRVLGAISNSDNFSQYFQCPRNSPMNPDEKCHVW